jgi:hypothetical protein
LGDDSVLRSGSHVVRSFGGSEQRLARHATCPGAIAANSVFFDECSCGPELKGEFSGDQPPRTRSDDHQIILLL